MFANRQSGLFSLTNLTFLGERGPFSSPSEFFKTFPEAELHFFERFPSITLEHADEDSVGLANGVRALREAVLLCDALPLTYANARSGHQFSILLDNFRLSNIMVPFLAFQLF